MAGRPRLYTSAAQKTQAYRQREAARVASVDRISYEQLEAGLRRLQLAVMAAGQAGDELARRLDAIMALDLLSDLADYFEERSKNPEAD
jgi:hypothetical protein